MEDFLNVIEKTKDFVKQSLMNAEPGHDWWHAYRVCNLSLFIAQKENCNQIEAIQLAALLHDIADAKFHQGDETIGLQVASKFLESIPVEAEIIKQILFVIEHISFKGGASEQIERNMVLDIVQDADRLDAMGAIGIARTFSYGGYKCRPLYDPNIAPNLKMSKEEYKASEAPTLNHFYEKLFKLKALMNTQTAKELATERHQFMEQFLAQFYREWDFGENCL